MQLLLVLLLLSLRGGGLDKDIRSLLETMGGNDLKNALNEAEAIAAAMELAKAFIPQPPAEVKTSEPDGGQVNGGKISPFIEVSSFADPEIIDALIKYVDG